MQWAVTEGRTELLTRVQIPYWDTEMSLISLKPFPVLVSVDSERLKETTKSNLTCEISFLCKLSMEKSLSSLETSEDPA